MDIITTMYQEENDTRKDEENDTRKDEEKVPGDGAVASNQLVKRKLEEEQEGGENNNGEDNKYKKRKKRPRRKNKGGKKYVKQNLYWMEQTTGRHEDGIAWKTLEHNGPILPPPYEHLPEHVNFYYDGKLMKLSAPAEEAATFYSKRKILENDYTQKAVFNINFYKDWCGEMTEEERGIIKDLRKCDFNEIAAYFKEQGKKTWKEIKIERGKWKEEKDKETSVNFREYYGFCVMDGEKQKLHYEKVEPPGFYRAEGSSNHGKLRKRVYAKDVTINIGEDATVPVPPEGESWQAVIHDNTVNWTAKWEQGGFFKYAMLHPDVIKSMCAKKEEKSDETTCRLNEERIEQICKKHIKNLEKQERAGH